MDALREAIDELQKSIREAYRKSIEMGKYPGVSYPGALRYRRDATNCIHYVYDGLAHESRCNFDIRSGFPSGCDEIDTEVHCKDCPERKPVEVIP